LNMKNITTQNGSTTLGIVLGVVLGLAVALGVSLYIANTGAPIQTKASNNAARIEPPKDPSKAPDPNESLYTKVPATGEAKPDDGKPVISNKPLDGTGKPNDAKPEQDGIGKIAALVTPSPVAVATSAAPITPIAPVASAVSANAASKVVDTVVMPKAAGSASGGERYFVQAGAYKTTAEAETVKAKLALQGVVMSVSPRDKDGQIVQRVRTAPLAAPDAEKLRNTLKANGIETSLVKVQ
jgi:cell division protein FtsN